MKSDATSRVEKALADCGLGEVQILTYPAGTRTAEEAAAAVGTSVGRIVKTLVIHGERGEAVVLVSGSNKLDVSRFRDLLGDDVAMATAANVKRITGFSIGGVAPLAFLKTLPMFVDADLLSYETVWAAAGSPSSVMQLRSEWLVHVLGCQPVKV